MSILTSAARLACLCLFSGAALAQQTPSPQTLNACTTRTDPEDMRRCIEASAGVDERFVPEKQASPQNVRPVVKDAGRFDEDAHAPKPSLLRDRGVADRAAGPPP